jgi:hypothetical protein
MSSQFSSALRDFADSLDKLGDDAIDRLAEIAANPEAAPILGTLAALVRLPVAPGEIAAAGTALHDLAGRAAPQPAQPEPMQPEPAQPEPAVSPPPDSPGA